MQLSHHASESITVILGGRADADFNPAIGGGSTPAAGLNPLGDEIYFMDTATENSSHSTTESISVSEQLSGTIRDIGIPPSPRILTEINIEIGKDEPDFSIISKSISSDVGLSAGLIALANSPYFASRMHVRSAQEALIKLGWKITSQAIAGIILKDLFPKSVALERFWHSSGCIARLSGWLANTHLSSLKIHAGDAYTFGLFRDNGIPLLINQVARYPDALQLANLDAVRCFTEVEDAVCRLNHAETGGLLAQGWYLPEEISIAIVHHHDYSLFENRQNFPIPQASLKMIAVALLAEHLYQHHTGLGMSCEWSKGGVACLDFLQLDEPALAEIYRSSLDVALEK